MSDRSPEDMDWRTRVFDSLSFPTLVLDVHRTIVSVNRKFLETIGAREEEIVGRTCRSVFYEYFYDSHLPCSGESCPLDSTVRDGTGHSLLRRVRNRDGTLRWEDRVFSPILDDAGRTRYVIESVRDVTRTKNLERMFHGIREFLDRVIQSSASAIVAADREGRILLMNHAAEELFGFGGLDWGGVAMDGLYPPGTAEEIRNKLADERLGGRGKLPLTRVNIRTADGRHIPVEMTGAIVYEGEREAATMAIYNDLRERLSVEKKLREAEQKIVQSEKMASLGRLAAGVAHEINNPLTGILLYGNMMAERIPEESELRDPLGYILEDAGRCRDIVQNLLAYSRQTCSSRERFSLNRLVEESLQLIRDQRLFLHIVIDRRLSASPMPVHADRNHLQQVVINLVINAIDAMDKKGTLTLKTFRDEESRRAVLLVADTGCGIDEADRSRVFDPFFTTKEPGRGTGLGLSTAYGIVKDNGGDIAIADSGPGGTVFRVSLPLAEPDDSGVPESIG